MRPIGAGVFKKHGSQDDEATELRGDEFWRCMRLYRQKGFYAVGFILTMCAGATPFLMNVFMGDFLGIMTGAQRQGFLDAVTPLLWKMVGVVLGMTVAISIGIGARTQANPMFMADLRTKCFAALLELDIQFFDEVPTGVLISRLSEDITLIRETYIDMFLQAVQSLTQACVGLILALVYCWRIGLMVIVAVPLSVGSFLVGDYIIDTMWFTFNETQTENASQAEEVLTQFRTVKAFDGELWEAARYERGLEGVRAVEYKAAWVHAGKDGVISMLVWGTLALLQYMVMSYIIRKPYIGLVAGDLMILQMSAMMAVMGASTALGQFSDFPKTAIAAAKVLELINRKPTVDRNDGETRINGGDMAVGKIEFRDVGFKYRGRDDYAVHHLNFVIEAGQTVAIVGESGSGKSTTLQLLQRFYEIQEGEILIDGVDIRRLAPSFIRHQIASVPQTPVLFTMSVRDNIRYACPDAEDADVAQAAAVGNAHNFIMELPETYGTPVQQGMLSGGQKQRVCISRAILQAAPILILDEATAALDTESEHLVQQSLENVRHGKTAIAVAHRLATVMHADKIFVMKDGTIVEEGTHVELLARDGFYADLVKYQLQ